MSDKSHISNSGLLANGAKFESQGTGFQLPGKGVSTSVSSLYAVIFPKSLELPTWRDAYQQHKHWRIGDVK